MAIGDALSKTTTYGNVLDITRLRTNTFDDTKLSDSLLLSLTSIAIQKSAKMLNGVNAPFYMTTNSTLTISGSANPYTVDLSSVAPFLDRLIRVVHVTTGGVRTLVRILSSEEAERIISLTTTHASSIFGVHEGDSIRLYKGASFTITTASDTVEIKYFRQVKVGTISSNAVVAQATFTVAADKVTITGLSGVTTAHVGGIFVGTDSAAALFAKTISQYVSASSFILASAVANAGAGTIGYVIPAASNAYTVTTGTYLDIPDPFVSLIIDEVALQVEKFKNNGTVNPALEQLLANERDSTMRAYGITQQTAKE